MAITLKDLQTPCFLVDTDKVKANTQRMLDTCKRLNTTLRPHTKTHKTIEFAEMSTGGTKRGIAVSTLREAKMYADAGFDDILYAYPITADKLDRCIKLMSLVSEFHVMVSDKSGVKCLQDKLGKLPSPKPWSVVIEIDTGYGRTGFLPESTEFLDAAKDVVDTMKLVALYCHCGGSYDIKTRNEREEHHRLTVSKLMYAKGRIQEERPNAKFVIGIGSTPSCSLPSDVHREVGEFHPGNYIFNDYEQHLLNSCCQKDIACCVMTRVVAHKQEKNMLIVDCGFLALGHDGIAQRPNDFCLIHGESNLKMIGMTQELGKIKAKEGELDCDKYPVGTIFYIYPYHSCLTAALHEVYYLHSGDQVIRTVKPCRGW